MNKFYVVSGLVKEIVLATNPVNAAVIAMRRLDGPILMGTTFRISEKGFDEHDDDTVISTSALLEILIEA